MAETIEEFLKRTKKGGGASAQPDGSSAAGSNSAVAAPTGGGGGETLEQFAARTGAKAPTVAQPATPPAVTAQPPPEPPPAVPPSVPTSWPMSNEPQVLNRPQGTVPTGPAPTNAFGATPAQTSFVTGVGQGLKQAADVPAELLAGGFNALQRQFTGKNMSDPSSWEGFRATSPEVVHAADLQQANAFQKQYGNDPNAQAGLRGGETGGPMALGGAEFNALRLAAKAGIPIISQGANLLSGFAGENMPGVLGWGLRRLSGAFGGALQGGTYTAASGDPNESFAERAAPGAATGAVLGSVVLPTLAAATKWVATRFGSADTPAAQQIIRALTRDKMTPDEVERSLSNLGPQAALADVDGANLQRLAEVTANSPGPAAQQARTFLTARAEAQSGKLDDAVRTATGSTGNAVETMDDLIAQRSKDAGPKYKAAFEGAAATPEQAAKLAPFIADPMGQKALQKGIDLARQEALAADRPFNLADYGVVKNPDGTLGLAPGAPNLRLYDAVKHGFDGVLEGNEYRVAPGSRLFNRDGKVLNDVRASFTGKLRDAFPKYAEALDAWAGPSQAMDALKLGEDFLKSDPAETAKMIAKMTEGEREMYRVGVSKTLKDKIASTPEDADATRRIFGNDLIRQKIAAGFGGADTPAFRNFENTVNQQATFAQTRNTVLKGSPTARRVAGMADEAGGPDLLRPALHAASGNFGMAAADIGKQLAGATARNALAGTEAQNQALGEMLFSASPEARARIMEAIGPEGAAAVRNYWLRVMRGAPGVWAGTEATDRAREASGRNPLSAAAAGGR